MPEHKYAAILRAIADGKTVQFRDNENVWYEPSPASLLGTLSAGVYQPDRFRIKPETISINGVKVPKPETTAPAKGTDYYLPKFTDDPSLHCRLPWHGDAMDRTVLSRGLVHLTKEAAEIHAKALLSFTEQPCQN